MDVNIENFVTRANHHRYLSRAVCYIMAMWVCFLLYARARLCIRLGGRSSERIGKGLCWHGIFMSLPIYIHTEEHFHALVGTESLCTCEIPFSSPLLLLFQHKASLILETSTSSQAFLI